MALWVYPRLNIHMNRGVSHMGLMHLVATNLIVWFRIILKESIIHYSDYKIHSEMQTKSFDTTANTRSFNTSRTGGKFINENKDKMRCAEAYHDNDFVEDILTDVSPFLLCFIIEFVLIGATVFWNTWNNVHNLTEDEINEMKRQSLKKPQLCATIGKTNWSHSKKGTMCGLFVFLLTLLEIMIFYAIKQDKPSFASGPGHQTFLEYAGKVVFTVLNTSGFCATVFGIIQIQWLPDKKKEEIEGGSMELFLLKIGTCFIFIYNCLTITIGVIGEFSVQTDEKPSDSGRALHMTHGIIEIMAVILQTIFIHLLHLKVKLDWRSLVSSS